MKSMMPLLLMTTAVAAILYILQHHQALPQPQDTHTGILTGTHYDSRNYCARAERPNPICDGERK